jgi:aminocarboxymuconate-semialdehyde decarboxylase
MSMLIDLHAHNFTMGMVNQHPNWGPFWEPNGLRIGKWVLGTKQAWSSDDEDTAFVMTQRFAPDNRIKVMDQRGMDKLVVSLPSHMYMYWTEPEFGVAYARTVNDEQAKYCEAYPDRLYFWAHAPLQDIPASVRELDRAVNELGAKGLGMGGANFGGREVDDPAFDPLWEKVCELGVPIFVHGYNQSVSWGDKADTDPYDTTSILGMNSDETKLFWFMVNGGVLDRFPDLRVYITHGGGFVPYQLGRFNATNKTMAPDSKNLKPVEEYRHNFYFDVEVHSIPMRRAIVEEIGADHLLYGDNFDGADGINFDLTEGLGISDEDREKIRSGNALKLIDF